MGKTEIYIYGASGHGLVIADIARAVGYEKIIFLDDNSEMKFTPNLKKGDIIIAIGNNEIRRDLQNKVAKAGFDVISLIHPSAIISPSAIIGAGSVIMPGVIINAKAKIGEGVILNSASVIEHECEIGDFAHISPNASLAGGVKVGGLSHIGIGASVIQKIKIGKNVTVGAGSVVIRDITDDCVAVGSPARVIKKKIIEC